MQRSGVIGVAAQSFGFGPASKAVAVARELADAHGCELVPLSEGLASEYFEREGLVGERPMHPRHVADKPDLDRVADRLDALLVVLDPMWAAFGIERLPTFFVDSLGFMWTGAYFDEQPALRRMTRYFVQDVFGAASALSTRGLSNLHPTSAIVSRPALPVSVGSSALFVHLGGLFNIYGTSSGLGYLANIVPILTEIDRRAGVTATAMSDQALRHELVPMSLRPCALTNSDVASHVATARAVMSSPGLTTLLECSAAGAAFLPLPPQNWSQALIVQHMAAMPASHSLWRFLADSYPARTSLPEEEGVAMVAERNRTLFGTNDFANAYVQEVVRVLADDTISVSHLGAPHDGAETCAREIARELGLLAREGDG